MSLAHESDRDKPTYRLTLFRFQINGAFRFSAGLFRTPVFKRLPIRVIMTNQSKWIDFVGFYAVMHCGVSGAAQL